MREIKMPEGIIIIELYRNNYYEYYVQTPDNANLYFSFAGECKFSKRKLMALYELGYFDYEISESLERCKEVIRL